MTRCLLRTIRPILPRGGTLVAVIFLAGLFPTLAQDSTTSDASAVATRGSLAVLTVKGEITDVMVESLRRRMDAAVASGAKTVVLELDTPGGLVTSALAIADMIKERTDVKTVAWVNPNAISGGALVAVACNEIVMARSARMGDSQVIMGGPSGVAAVPEELQPKAYTPVLAEFRASATRNGYSQVLSEAFVIPEREVWWLERLDSGEREFVFRAEKMRRLGEKEESDGSITTSTPFAPEWKLVESYHDILLNRDVPAIQPVVPGDQLLQMSSSEAYAYGFSEGVVVDDGELQRRYAATALERLAPNWSESLAYWLTSMYVRGFLMVVMLLAAYVEFHTPGVGLPGLVALICLAVFVGAPYLTGLADVWEILLVILGIALILLELLVIPGFGVAGISGLILVLIGLLATFVPPEPGRPFPLYMPTFDATVRGLTQGIKIIAVSMVVSLAGMVIMSRYLPRSPFFRRVVPANPTPSQVRIDDPYLGAAHVGDLGETICPLHPAGKARFGTVLVDVVTQGELLEVGERVEVIERRGNRVVVRAARERLS